jgi:hypothetical protein
MISATSGSVPGGTSIPFTGAGGAATGLPVFL